MDKDINKRFEEWKVVRATIVEFDHILSNIRSLDVTATTILLGAGFQYSNFIFIIVIIFNLAFLLLEIHYHKYLNTVALYAQEIEDEIGFELTKRMSLSRNKYKEHKKLSIGYLKGYFIANVYYLIYWGFMILGLYLFLR
ncbi:hypothetical protein DU57_12330 [Methanosarcina mazei]|jgi:hypothetical protein|uniref:Uncharacterized protein n=1 Tax=Methanosarcina mazei TaxID=2209 RepID=A0A0F8ISG3_METMZ|nr:hypothetical protein [Methanosarcina mazei]KKG82394.1 hypothetical protein DU57_12330 [Methanosarcina mazei]KKG87763.1 hypothetical protein DU59_07560 [Methanosarcina mazei]KKH05530.1 hypothetical protein DU42_12215 [Methanosarcina mazei]